MFLKHRDGFELSKNTRDSRTNDGAQSYSQWCTIIHALEKDKLVVHRLYVYMCSVIKSYTNMNIITQLCIS